MGLFEDLGMCVVRAGVGAMSSRSRSRGGSGCLVVVIAVLVGAIATVGAVVA